MSIDDWACRLSRQKPATDTPLNFLKFPLPSTAAVMWTTGRAKITFKNKKLALRRRKDADVMFNQVEPSAVVIVGDSISVV